jgi:C1A family cysteine protease
MSEREDHSAQLGAVRDQGKRGTCLAFGVTAAHEKARLRRRGGERAVLGEELLHWRCKQIDGDGQDGTGPASAAQALHDPGQSAAELWPYDGGRDEQDPAYAPPAGALEADAMRLANLSSTSSDAAEIRERIREGHAVVLGLDLWPGFYSAHGGILSAPSAPELFGEGHAVTVVGFDESAEWLLIRNSWGESWGEGGHARLPEAALEVAGLGAWIVEDDIDS